MGCGFDKPPYELKALCLGYGNLRTETEALGLAGLEATRAKEEGDDWGDKAGRQRFLRELRISDTSCWFVTRFRMTAIVI